MLSMNPFWVTLLPPIPGFGTGDAIFAGGLLGGTYTTLNENYSFVDNSVTPATYLATGNSYLGGAGNTSEGVFAGGSGASVAGVSYNATTNVYTYARSTCVNGTNISTPRYGIAGMGNSSAGYFNGGVKNPSGVFTYYTTVDVYTYAGDTVVTGGALRTVRSDHASASNATIGIVAGGDNNSGFVATTDIYTFSSKTASAGSSLTTSTNQWAAIGNTTTAYFNGGQSTSAAVKYTYASNTFTAITFLSPRQPYLAATGNSTTGVFSGATSSTTATITQLYTFANDTYIAGRNLTAKRQTMAATSTTPGGF